MSLKFREARGKYEVRWLEGSHHRSRLFARKGDAEAFDLDVRRRKQLGALAPTVIRTRTTSPSRPGIRWRPWRAITQA